MPSRGYPRAKRAGDVVAASLGLAVSAPVLAVAASAVRRSMGTPVLFRQQRSGRDGRPFAILKLRTMRALRPGEDPFGSDDERLTPLGRWLRSWSVDEVPQLLNVLRGEMSIVGPRPLPTAYLERYSAEQRRRLEVLPGITGWAQVNGRNAVDWDERLAMDVWYVDHASLRLDLRILWLTLRAVVRRQGTAAEGFATMPEFTGPKQHDAG